VNVGARVQAAANALAGVLFLLLFLLFLAQIVARLLLHAPLPWSDEAVVVLYVWIILWGAACVVPEREHVAFDLVWNLASERARSAMHLAGHALLGGLALAALPATWDYVHFMQRERTPVLGLPFFWVFLPLVVLVLSMVLRSVRVFWRAALSAWQATRGRAR